jgi:hypothetical protein
MKITISAFSLTTLIALAACQDSQPAVRVSIPVEVDGAGMKPSTNDLGWTVTLTTFRFALRDMQFTILGEMHARAHRGVLRRLAALVEGEAWAHPGHYAGGEVTGELPGPLIADFFATERRALGLATLLTGIYHGANFFFRHAEATDGLASDDPLLGHTAYLVGSATKEGRTIDFRAQVDIDDGTQVVGAPFELAVKPETQTTLGFEALTTDPVENQSLFQLLDFGAYDTDGDHRIDIVPGTEAHAIFRRTLVTHSHYFVGYR